MNKKYFIKTMGCQMNVHDSEKIAGIFSELGYQQAAAFKESDVIVLNTCSVRAKAEQKFSSELGRLKLVKTYRPGLRIAVAGCIAQQMGKTLFKRFPYVDFVFGPNNIDSLEQWINNDRQGSDDPLIPPLSKEGKGGSKTVALKDNPEYHTKKLPIKRAGLVRAWVSIMYGCDNFCAYCVVPSTRGRERSRPSKDIFNEVESLAEQGFKEITLLGQNVNSYGKNVHNNIDFPDLLKKIHDINGIERIRFVTSHPRDFSEKLISAMKDLPKICGHMHLPLQSGSDSILTAMNRGYTYSEYKGKIEMLRNAIKEISVTSDIIVGFPGETDDDFKCTVEAISELKFDGIFSFKYSRRPQTRALELPGHIDEIIKSKRLAEILDLQVSITYDINKALEGEILEILVEGISSSDKEKLTGRTTTNKIVNFSGDESDIGRIMKIRILRAQQHSLFGEKVM
jgi:tRNA-2-methylthio-N6-dimethylallyladenosine synthase